MTGRRALISSPRFASRSGIPAYYMYVVHVRTILRSTCMSCIYVVGIDESQLLRCST